MTSLKTVLKDLKEKNGYKFGKPWHGKETVASVVPILLTTQSHKREYVMLEEVKDKVSISDTGSIQRLNITGQIETPIFCRSGTILKGNKTQDRAIEISKVVQQGKEDLDVRCIHASHMINRGSGFEVSGYTPVSVHKALLERSQTKVWGSVSRFASSSMHYSSPVGRSGMEGLRGSEHEMLAGISDRLVDSVTAEDYSKQIDKFIREIPSFENQVGIIVIDMVGVLGIELFDHPDSWKEVSKTVIRKYGEVFSKPAKTPFKLDLDDARLTEAIQGFIEAIEAAKEQEVEHNTFILSGRIKGEYTIFKQRLIHLIALRTDKEDQDEVRIISSRSPRTRERERDLGAQQDNAPINRIFMSTPPGYAFEPQVQSMSLKKGRIMFSGFTEPNDEILLASLDTFAKKKCQGDRSKAVKHLLSKELKNQGFLCL